MENFFFERLAKVKKAKLRDGNEYQWSANVYNPGTGEVTICGYWKMGKEWKFIDHRENGFCLEESSSCDIILEEPEQWVNVITRLLPSYISNKEHMTSTYVAPEIYPSSEYASSEHRSILNSDPMNIDVTARKLS